MIPKIVFQPAKITSADSVPKSLIPSADSVSERVFEPVKITCADFVPELVFQPVKMTSADSAGQRYKKLYKEYYEEDGACKEELCKEELFKEVYKELH